LQGAQFVLEESDDGTIATEKHDIWDSSLLWAWTQLRVADFFPFTFLSFSTSTNTTNNVFLPLPSRGPSFSLVINTLETLPSSQP
jgi:hypothetical protein